MFGVRRRERAHPNRAEARAAKFGTPGCVIGGLFVFALLVLLITRILPAAVHAFRRLRQELRGDRPAALLVLAARGLPLAYQDWGQAMRNELDHVYGDEELAIQRRLRLGRLAHPRPSDVRPPCPRRMEHARPCLRGIAAALTLAAYGLFHYPGLRSGYNAWASVLVLALLLGYAVITLALSSDQTAGASVARRYGLAGGLAIGAAWYIMLSPTDLLKGWVMVPWPSPYSAPPALQLSLDARRDARMGTQAALWAGIIGGLVVFLVGSQPPICATAAHTTTACSRDFHRSGAPDLATYAVSDNLGSGLVLLLLVPTVALALGSISARLASKPSVRAEVLRGHSRTLAQATGPTSEGWMFVEDQ